MAVHPQKNLDSREFSKVKRDTFKQVNLVKRDTVYLQTMVKRDTLQVVRTNSKDSCIKHGGSVEKIKSDLIKNEFKRNEGTRNNQKRVPSALSVSFSRF